MDFSIREATLEDYSRICEVYAEADALHIAALPHVFREPVGAARSRAYIADLIADDDVALFVAESAGQIIGVVCAMMRWTPDSPIIVPGQYVWIQDIAVLESHRHSGVGQALMGKAQRWALDKGVTQVALTVWEFNEGAIAFYEKLGYNTASRRMWISLE